MKKAVLTNSVARGRSIPVENTKNIALKKSSSKEHAANKEKKPAANSDIVTLTQSELDAILGAIGKLSKEKG